MHKYIAVFCIQYYDRYTVVAWIYPYYMDIPCGEIGNLDHGWVSLINIFKNKKGVYNIEHREKDIDTING